MALPTNTNNGDSRDPKRDSENENPMLPPSSPRATPRRPGPAGFPAPPTGLPTPMPPRSRPVAPPPEDDAFEPLSIEETLEDEEDSFTPPPRRPQPQRVVPEPEPEPAYEEESFDAFEQTPQVRSTPPRDSSLEDEEVNFVDKKKKKLLPFGGSKSKQTSSDNDIDQFDTRQDRRTKAKAVQIGALAAIVGMVGFGGYNAINPPAGVSAEEVNLAIQASQTASLFPTERASSFAEDFMEAYLTISGASSTDDIAHQAILSYYYTGSLSSSSSTSTNITLESSQVRQEILVSPKVFRAAVSPDNPTVANLIVGALVRTTKLSSTTSPDDPRSAALNGAKWVYFSINVYYDKATDMMAVTKDSPSLMPPIYFGNSADIPPEATLGQPDDKLKASVADSLEGFLEAFALSSPSNSSRLTNYIVDDTEPDLYNGMKLLTGMNGDWALNGDFESAVTYTVYPDLDDPSGNSVKIDATVTWQDTNVTPVGSTTETARLTVKSRYFIKMTLDGKKRWVVSWFSPRIYREAPKVE